LTDSATQLDLVAAYRTMRLIRSFEELVVTLVNSNEIAGVTHEYIGQEAVATGVCAALDRNDVLTSTHRGHGHLLARGAAPAAMLAELLGRETGLNRGRGGSMHIADVSLGIYGANGIVGAGVPFCLGAASVPSESGPRVAVAFFGDGALNQGVLLESMNLASVWGLPVIFCCENNGYAVTTPSSRSTSVSPTVRAGGFGIPALEVDGMDVAAVYSAAASVVEQARSGGGPSLLDCRCYRFVGHHTAERTMRLSYRSDNEIEEWRLRDPLTVAHDRLRQLGIDESSITNIDAEVATALEADLELARRGSVPDAGSALDYQYASPTMVRWGMS
jgi:TPP-dependent pyruvate/acetoin dehydrogenase alpha subunit